MKLIEIADEQKDLLNEDRNAHFAVWQETQKDGKRGWFTLDILLFDDYDDIAGEKRHLAEIVTSDSNAILLTGSCFAEFGSADEPLSAANVAKGIKKHYLTHDALISDYLKSEELRAF